MKTQKIKERKKRFNFQLFFDKLIEYKEEFGNLNVPAKYITNGYKLGIKVDNVRTGRIKLTPEQSVKLNGIEFVWNTKIEGFEKFYNELLKYKKEFGNLNVPVKYITKGYKLGQKVHHVRTGYIKSTPEQVAKLNGIEFVWNARIEGFEKFYNELLKYKKEFGNLNVPQKYITNGYKLGIKVHHVRTGYIKSTPEQVAKLNGIEFVWNARIEGFEKFYNELLKYKKEFGNLNVPQKYITNGYKLGIKVHHVRCGQIKIKREQRKMLDEIGFVWKSNFIDKLKDFKFSEFYNNFKEYTQKTNDYIVSFDTTIDNYELGFYTRHIRTKRIKLLRDQEEKLKNQGFLFDTFSLLNNLNNDEQSLLERMLQGDMKARAKIIEKTYKYVNISASKFKGLTIYSDLISLGEEKLVDAVDRFPTKHKKDIKFQYCKNYIRKYILTSMQTFIKQTEAEKITSLSEPIDKNESGTLEDIIADKKANTEKPVVDTQFTFEMLKQLKGTLTKSEYTTVCLHFGFTKSKETYTFSEIAEKYNASEKQVKKVYSKAINKLKDSLDENEWNIYNK